jgi:hypothetical protein
VSARGRKIGGTIWLFVFILAASAGGILILGTSAAHGTTFEPYSTYRAEPDGASACFEWLQGLDKDCRRETEELLTLPEDGSLLVMIAPTPHMEMVAGVTTTTGGRRTVVSEERVMSDREAEAVLAWVKTGGRLLILEGRENTIYKALRIDVGGNPVVQEEPVGEGLPASLSTITANGARLSLANKARLSSEDPAFTPLYRDEQGEAVGLTRSLEKGQVIALADPSIVTNAGLLRGGNAVIISEIVEDSPLHSRIVRFDELRHGFAAERNVMGFAKRYGLHLALVQAGLAFVMVVWACARPKRRIRGAAALEKHIESREFVSAMANIYARAHLEEHAALSFLRRCDRSLQLAIGAPPGSLTPQDLAQRLRTLGIQNYRGYEAVQEESAALGIGVAALPGRTKPRIRERRLVSFARLTTQLEREVRDAARITVDQVIA